jgi:hypothetical protein
MIRRPTPRPRTLKALGDKIHPANLQDTQVSRRLGIVKSIDIDENTVQIQSGSAGSPYFTARYLNSYRPKLDDQVWVDFKGRDALIVGSHEPKDYPPDQKIYYTSYTSDGSDTTFELWDNLTTDYPDIEEGWAYVQAQVVVDGVRSQCTGMQLGFTIDPGFYWNGPGIDYFQGSTEGALVGVDPYVWDAPFNFPQWYQQTTGGIIYFREGCQILSRCMEWALSGFTTKYADYYDLGFAAEVQVYPMHTMVETDALAF